MDQETESSSASISREPATPAGKSSRVFGTTLWTVVLQAGGPTSGGSAAALEQLFRTYWYPLYSYARRSGVPNHDAEDLTQSFFAYLLEKDAISRANRDRGRFRSFLLASFKNFQNNERTRVSAAKRGGGRTIVSFDELQAEDRYRNEPRDTLPAEILYDQKWASSLVDKVMAALGAEYASLGKKPLFDVLRQVVWGGADQGYEELARRVGTSTGAFKVAVHRLRTRFKECLRQEVAQTVATPGEVDDELRYLLSALNS